MKKRFMDTGDCRTSKSTRFQINLRRKNNLVQKVQNQRKTRGQITHTVLTYDVKEGKKSDMQEVSYKQIKLL